MKVTTFNYVVYGVTVVLAIILLLSGCRTSRDKRGVDWMKWYDEERAFQHEPIDWGMRRSPWYRNYYTNEEIQQMWKDTMLKIKAERELEDD